MAEHLIRLRAGWFRTRPDDWANDPDPDPESDRGERITLPIRLAEEPAWRGRLRLSRSFQRPPVDLARETLALRLDHVRGLVSARLNGREIARPDPGTAALEIPLNDGLRRRNLLVLDVDLDPSQPAGPPTPDGPWGEIALVIRPIFP